MNSDERAAQAWLERIRPFAIPTSINPVYGVYTFIREWEPEEGPPKSRHIINAHDKCPSLNDVIAKGVIQSCQPAPAVDKDFWRIDQRVWIRTQAIEPYLIFVLSYTERLSRRDGNRPHHKAYDRRLLDGSLLDGSGRVAEELFNGLTRQEFINERTPQEFVEMSSVEHLDVTTHKVLSRHFAAICRDFSEKARKHNQDALGE